MIRSNEDIRTAIEFSDLKYWQVAEKYGITDGNFSKKLRRELPNEEKIKIMKIISELTKGKEA